MYQNKLTLILAGCLAQFAAQVSFTIESSSEAHNVLSIRELHFTYVLNKCRSRALKSRSGLGAKLSFLSLL